MSGSQSAEQITRASRSNLALAFVSLPRKKRADITLFYAFCRIIDDIADAGELPSSEKQRQLGLWRQSLEAPLPGEHPLAPALRQLIQEYSIARELFCEILAGVEMDLAGARFATFEQLSLYCYRVASAVGLVSIEIFGYRNPRCKEYAVALGMALQLTNILRDIDQDFQNGARIYLPDEDLQRFGVTPADLRARRHNDAFLGLLRFEAERALGYYKKAQELLPPEDRHSMLPAEIMRRVYGRLLNKMRNNGFRVFSTRYRLCGLEKSLVVSGSILLDFFHRPRRPSRSR